MILHYRLTDISQHLATLFINTDEFRLQTASAMLLAQLWESDSIGKEPETINTVLDAIHRTLYIQDKQVHM
jgi:hypothetical protein